MDLFNAEPPDPEPGMLFSPIVPNDTSDLLVPVSATSISSDLHGNTATSDLGGGEDYDFHKQKLDTILKEYADRFDPDDSSPFNMRPADVKLKPEFKDRVFYQPERRRSPKEQTIINKNGKRLIKENKARLNPKSKHNISQVIVPRFDKNGFPIEGRERVCLNLPPINKGFEPFKHPIPKISDVTQQLMESSWYTEFDLDQGYEQLKVDGELVDLLTFTCRFGKVSMLVMPYGVIFGSDIFPS